VSLGWVDLTSRVESVSHLTEKSVDLLPALTFQCKLAWVAPGTLGTIKCINRLLWWSGSFTEKYFKNLSNRLHLETKYASVYSWNLIPGILKTRSPWAITDLKNDIWEGCGGTHLKSQTLGRQR
jgi:hypothetical protein